MQLDHERRHRRPIGPTLLDIIAHAENETDVDILALLRTLVTAVETPADRLFARYHGRSSRPALIYAAYRD